MVQPLHPSTAAAATPVLLTPECGAPGCRTSGDQYTMVRCRACRAWFCPDHIDPSAGARVARPGMSVCSGLAYYQGICVPCRRSRHVGD